MVYTFRPALHEWAARARAGLGKCRCCIRGRGRPKHLVVVPLSSFKLVIQLGLALGRLVVAFGGPRKMRATAPTTSGQRLGLNAAPVRAYSNPMFQPSRRDVSANVLSLFAPKTSDGAKGASKQVDPAVEEMPPVSDTDFSIGTISMRRSAVTAKKGKTMVSGTLTPSQLTALQRQVLNALGTAKGELTLTLHFCVGLLRPSIMVPRWSDPKVVD